MSWLAIASPAAAAIALVMLPGLGLAYAARMRGISAWGMAPAISMSVYAVLGLGFGVAHLTWNLATVALATIVVVVAVGALAWWLTRRRSAPVRDKRSVLGAGLAAAGVSLLAIGIRFAVGFIHPDNVSQTFDANFHLNGVRYILSTGDVNPLTFGDLQYAYHGYGSLYPNLWHMVASLVAEAGGASIPVAVNAFSIVIGGVVWPLSCLYLTRQLLGARRTPLLVTGALAACFAAFPLLLVDFGVLYPNFLGIALVPAALGSLIVGLGRARGSAVPRWSAWISLFVMLVGISLAHPNALVSLMVLGIPPIAAAAAAWFRAARARGATASRHLIVWGVLFAVAVAFLAIFIKVRPALAAASWPPSLGPRRAIADAVLNSQLGPPAVAVSILVIVGLVATVATRRNIWLIGSWAIAVVLYVGTAWLPMGAARYWLTGTWYSDVNRLIALEPVVLTPLATIGTMWLGALVVSLLRRRARRLEGLDGRRSIAVVALVVTLVAFVGAQAGPSLTHATAATATAYRLDESSPLLSADERALIDRLPGEVPADALIAGDPWTGTSLAWALGDRRVLAPHIYSTWPPGGALILESLRTATRGSAVCKAVNDLGVRYALDFGTHGVFGETNQYPGVHHLAGSKAVKLVDSQGKAALYRITACS